MAYSFDGRIGRGWLLRGTTAVTRSGGEARRGVWWSVVGGHSRAGNEATGSGAAACRLQASGLGGGARLLASSSDTRDDAIAESCDVGKRTLAERVLAHGCRRRAKSVSLARQGGKINTSAHTAIFFRSPDLIPPLARRGRHAALWLPLHVADRVPPREAGPRSRLPSTNPPYTHTTPHYSPHLTPHCSRLYVATFLVQCTRVPIRVNVGF